VFYAIGDGGLYHAFDRLFRHGWPCGRTSDHCSILPLQSRIQAFMTIYCRYSRLKTDIDVRIVAVGTGQALRNAKKCDAELVIVHSKIDEEKFVIDGFGSQRHDLMYNDFILVGPKNDPAQIGTAKTTIEAFQKIAAGQSQIRVTKR
jgi:hypothetical protein